MYLIDSDFLIDFLKNKKETVSLISSLNSGELHVSIVSVGEILEGVPQKEIKKYLKFFSNFIIINIDIPIIIKFAEIRRELRKKGKLLDNFDLLIASTCLSRNLKLITGNKKHFNRINGLKIA